MYSIGKTVTSGIGTLLFELETRMVTCLPSDIELTHKTKGKMALVLEAELGYLHSLWSYSSS
jgi:hypothetical protein